MITVGTETKLAVQWAAELSDPDVGKLSLLVPYKNALVYIDKRGLFDHTFASRGELEDEVQRVLDVRLRFGDQEDWPEFPFPTKWQSWKESQDKQVSKPQPKPLSWAQIAEQAKSLPQVKIEKPTQTIDGLISAIVKNELKYRGDAISYLQSHASVSSEHTVCIMWTLDGDCRKKSSGGGSYDVSNLRDTYGVPTGKETICAEEIFLLKNGIKGWVVSASYDMRNGWKCACKKGCATLLGALQIIDIAEDLFQKAWQGGARSWSKI